MTSYFKKIQSGDRDKKNDKDSGLQDTSTAPNRPENEREDLTEEEQESIISDNLEWRKQRKGFKVAKKRSKILILNQIGEGEEEETEQKETIKSGLDFSKYLEGIEDSESREVEECERNDGDTASPEFDESRTSRIIEVSSPPKESVDGESSPSSPGPTLVSTHRLSIAQENLQGQIEALLFVSQKPLSERTLAKELSVEIQHVRLALRSMKEQSSQARGIEPIEVAGGWQLRTKPEHSDLLQKYLQSKPSKLGKASLETLAIVAYKQPLTRAEVEDIRGVESGGILRGLMEKRLLRILGRKEEPGRPILYGTSSSFLELFGLKSLKELPSLREFVELTEEHQRLVDREAPDYEEQTAQEIQDYINVMENAAINETEK